MTPESAISIRDVSFSFDRHPVLSAVNLEIERGDFVSLIGPNGGGKTTLLRLILGLLVPDRGTIHVLGTSPSRARQRIGYMPQHVNLDAAFPVTVMDIVLMGRQGRRRPFGPYLASDRAAAENALGSVEAYDLKDRSFAALSGGERQRVLIARALACNPELLMLDEPTASLDPEVQDDLYELLKRLNERMTLVLVSHDVSVVSKHVNKVACVCVSVEQHATAEIKGELTKLFPSRSGVRFVHHDHHHPHPERER